MVYHLVYRTVLSLKCAPSTIHKHEADTVTETQCKRIEAGVQFRKFLTLSLDVVERRGRLVGIPASD